MRGGFAKLMRSAFANPKQVPLLGYGENRENDYFPAQGKPSTSFRHGCRDTVKHRNSGYRPYCDFSLASALCVIVETGNRHRD